MRHILTAILILFAWASFSFAAPAPTAPASMPPGTSVTITGTGFGSKSPAAPIIWETFDSGTDGQALGGWNGWVKYLGSSGGWLSNTTPYSGTLSAYNRVIAGSSESFNTSYKSFSPTDEIYYSYQARMISTGDPYGVDKWGRSNSDQADSAHYNGPGEISIGEAKANFNSGTDVLGYGDLDDLGLERFIYTRNPWPSGWIRHEMYKLNSTPGVANGIAQFKVGNTQRTYTNKVTREAGYTFQQTDIILGLMFANAQNDGDHRMYVDDVYVDNTRARVELCTGSTWANRGNCNPQPPTSWATTSVTVTANTSSFTDGQEVFLYVVDADGLVNSLGVSTEVGEGGEVPPDTTPPVLSLLSPSGTLAAGTTSTTISLVTDEAATCKYSATSGTAYASMTLAFDSSFALSHSATVSGLTNGGSYTRYVRCIDGAGNANTSDATISFSVASSAGTAGTLSWEYSTYSAERSDVRIPINIVRTGGSTGSVTVQWSSNGQTATHNVDYYGNDNVTVTFADGVTSMPINTYGTGDDGILMIDNGADEDRYFQMILSNSTGGATLGTTLATVTIEGDYVPPVLGMRIGVGTSRVGTGSTMIIPLQ